MTNQRERIGVFVCHCGLNIGGVVDIARVVAEIQKYQKVVYAGNYLYMCSDPGQELMRKAIREHQLTSVINANCSPSLHEKTFRNLCAAEGLNPYKCEIANIREQCSWPHSNDKEAATLKAIAIIKTTVEKLRLNMMLTPFVISLNRQALVIGGGIAGMQVALDIADGGYKVILVEKAKCLGGRVMELSSTFPSLENPTGIMKDWYDRISKNPNIKVLLNAEIIGVTGYIGNFLVTIQQEDQTTEIDAGAIVAAPGFQFIARDKLPLYPEDPDIIDSLQFERMLAHNSVKRPSNGKVPENIVFVQCAGSRDPEHGMPYCSRICCMYTAKHVQTFKKQVPTGQAYVCYMDIRADAKGFEEYVQGVMSQPGVLYVRGNVARIFREHDGINVWVMDTLSGKNLNIRADMVVLALAIVPRKSTQELARKLNISVNEHGFLTEAHIKLRPVESLTAGVFLAGTGQWPRDIPDTISSASACASKVLSLFSRKELLHEPTVARVDGSICSGCGLCVNICAYKAITLDERHKLVVVNQALCEGCGSCAAACPSKAMQHTNWSHRQVFAMIDIAGCR
jgi:heterodisulfide reductase subunit A2